MAIKQRMSPCNAARPEEGIQINQPILKISNINKSFPGVKALDNISLEIQQGEVHALLGENGAGKSTLVKIIAGAYRKDDGEIFFDGQIREFTSPADAYHCGISIIYQETSLIPQLSVLQNIFLGIEPTYSPFKIVDTKRLLREYHAVSEKLGCRFPSNEPARNLSVAEQKMVEILKAMVRQASFLIMDEPTDSLADTEILRLFDIIRDLKNHKITVLYITHYLEEVMQITDRLTVLRDGKKVATTDTKDVTPHDIVKMMVGQELSIGAAKATANTSPHEAIRIESLSREHLLSDISFTAYRGEILGITGVIGAGKTELARAIFGADTIDAGQMFLFGKPCQIRSPLDAVRHGVGMLPEDRKHLGLLLNHEVYTNMTITALDRFISNMILSKSAELDATVQMIDRLDIKVSSPYQIVKYLSGGNQQKIVIGKWLTANPRILIMDEPTRGIDVGSKNEIYKIVKHLAEEGTCILFISSEVPEILEVSDRILVMKNGRIRAEYQRGVTQKEVMQAILEGER